jgi:hypothetical protein
MATLEKNSPQVNTDSHGFIKKIKSIAVHLWLNYLYPGMNFEKICTPRSSKLRSSILMADIIAGI